ncbi:MAG: Lon-like protease [Gaiellaceae bacterium]|jgi:PDZ domain-containing protein|nr:Lon-like protease [Gaiellaceae bacterium]
MARLLSPFRLVSAGVILLAVVLVILVTRGSDSYLEVPDQAHPLQGLVQVPGAKDPTDGGDIYYVDVLLRPASLLESLVPAVRPEGSDLVARTLIVEPGISDKERFQLDLAAMKVSQATASVVALRQLGYHVPIRPDGVRVVAITSGSHAAGLVKPGDVIVGADGTRVRTRTDLAAALARHKPGDVVKLVIRRGGRRVTLSIRTTVDSQNRKRAIIGVLPIQALHVQLPFPIKFNLRKVGGPSAGLAFALELLEQKGRDVDHGYKVAATGEIELNGSVTRIGGIKQKTIGARKSHVDVFLVPVDGDNARDAKRYAHGLKIIPVKTFQQALRALATLPKKG